MIELDPLSSTGTDSEPELTVTPAHYRELELEGHGGTASETMTPSRMHHGTTSDSSCHRLRVRVRLGV